MSPRWFVTATVSSDVDKFLDGTARAAPKYAPLSYLLNMAETMTEVEAAHAADFRNETISFLTGQIEFSEDHPGATVPLEILVDWLFPTDHVEHADAAAAVAHDEAIAHFQEQIYSATWNSWYEGDGKAHSIPVPGLATPVNTSKPNQKPTTLSTMTTS